MWRSALSCLAFAVGGAAAAAVTATTAIDASNLLIKTAGDLSGSIAGNLGTRLVDLFGNRLGAASFLDGFGSRSEDFDVVIHGLRRSQLKALRIIGERFDKARATDPHSERAAHAALFADLLGSYIESAERAAGAFSGDTARFAEQEEALYREVVGLLPDVAVAGRGRADRATAVNCFRAPAERITRAELLGSVHAEIPPLFALAFAGDRDGRNGWFDFFVRDVAAQLIAGSEFERSWNNEQVAVVRGMVEGATTSLDEVASWLRSSTESLRLAVGNLNAVRRAVEAIRDQLAASPLGLEFMPAVVPVGLRRFSPYNINVPFLGRQTELDALDTFLRPDDTRTFLWWVITGSGGSGKTRLARHLCLRAHGSGWRAGFLPSPFVVDLAALATWRPEAPTLIVADYVLNELDAVRRLAARLASRKDDVYPIRLLLLERVVDEAFIRQFCGTRDGDGLAIESRCYNPTPLALCELSDDDLWSLCETCSWRADDAQVTLNQEPFIARLAVLDKQRRPLIAMILADAIAAGSYGAGFNGLQGELRHLLERERKDMWSAQLRVQDRAIGSVDADIVIAFATMVGGIDVPDLPALDAGCGHKIDRGIIPDCSLAIGKRLTHGDSKMEPLQPDLIGEFFVLEALSPVQDNPYITAPNQWMPEAAWKLRPSAMRDFALRAIQNFSDHDATGLLAKPIPGSSDSWWVAASWAALHATDYADYLRVALEFLKGDSYDDRGAAGAFGMYALLKIAAGRLFDKREGSAILDEMASIYKTYPDEPNFRGLWAAGVVNYVSSWAQGETGECNSFL